MRTYITGEEYGISEIRDLDMMMPNTSKNVMVMKYKDRYYNAHLRFKQIDSVSEEDTYLLTEIYDYNVHAGIDNILVYPREVVKNETLMDIIKNFSKI